MAPARKVYLPSSLGISVLAPEGVKTLSAEVLWGDYKEVPSEDPEHPERKVWQRTQRRHAVDLSLPPPQSLDRTELLDRCELARRRIAQGLVDLEDPLVLEAFRIANRAMAAAARQRAAQLKGWRPDQVSAPSASVAKVGTRKRRRG
jgi:hypothetical protein